MTNRSERYTPPDIFAGLKLSFDLDPCAAPYVFDLKRILSGDWEVKSRSALHVPARKFYTIEEDGLAKPWEGMVWMNCPWTGRHTQVPWLQKFIQHGNGVGILLAYTSSDWFHDYMDCMDGLMLPRGKTRYLLPDGSRDGSPPMGSIMFAIGELAATALRLYAAKGRGLFWEPDKKPPSSRLCGFARDITPT
ncbi:MAG: hypothetical protein HUJ26_12665 [Planctomycetaceae bacterium]|nr:hypothetical protein [Planctomycetaceae bacterium]